MLYVCKPCRKALKKRRGRRREHHCTGTGHQDHNVWIGCTCPPCGELSRAAAEKWLVTLPEGFFAAS